MNKVFFNSIELKTLAAASWLSDSGVEVSLSENEKKFSFDSSFTLANRVFDVGYHAVDIGRNRIWDDVLSRLPIKWHQTEGSRALVSFGMTLKRFYSQSDLGEKFKNIDRGTYTDPYLRSLEGAFGTAFIDYVLAEIVPSYAQNSIWKKKEFGSSELLKNIYPWFFPADSGQCKLPSVDHFHAIERPLGVRYPYAASFGSISKALKLQLQGDIARGASAPLALTGEHINSRGEISIPCTDAKVFVAAIDYFSTAKKLGLSVPEFDQTNFYLTSIVGSNALKVDFNEYLVGELRHRFDRISSPDFLRGADEIRTLQFETELLEPVNESVLIDELMAFAKTQFGLASADAVDVKNVKINRFSDPDLTEKTEAIVKVLEDANPGFVVSNRSLAFQNLSDGVPQLISRIEDSLNEQQ
ncbi:hypothetical protein OAT10_01850 [Luminiphilus sp.]|nr:hypothetical protein [Luminiphilus sp.]